jgi:ATP-binding cassette subfamily B protein
VPDSDPEVLEIGRLVRLRRALRLVWESSPGWTLTSGALVTVQGLLPLATLYLLKLVLDAVTAGLASGDAATAFRTTAIYIALMGVVSLLTALAQALAALVSETQAHVVAQYMHGKIHAKSLEVDLDYYENPRYFDTFHRAQQEAGHRPTRVLNGLFQVGRSAVALLGIAGLLFAFHWLVGVLLFVALLPGMLVRLRHSGTVYRWRRERTESERKANYFDWLLTMPFPAMEVRLFELGSFFRERFNEIRERLIREQFRISKRRFFWEGATQVGATLAVFGSYLFIAYRALGGLITIGDLAMYFQAFQRGQAFLRELLAGIASLYEDSLFLESLDEFLALKPRVVAPAVPARFEPPLRQGIEFEGVAFSYPSSDRNVLESVDLRIDKGEMVALVGENGAGKTTLVKLLCRLYDPTAGRITLDGVDLRQYDPTELRRLISVVFQEYGRYQLRASENIWLGDVHQPLSAERVEKAARMSGAHEVISKLRHGYDTYLGKWFEDGEELSVGEWQKVALARAYLRSGELLILDEPTSALDPKAEYEVFRHLQELTRGRASVIISHRFSTVRMADRIYVIEGGRIVESGSHDELMRGQSSYKNLYERQAKQYQ